MAEREDEMLQYCQEQGIIFEAYEAMRHCPFSDPRVQNISQAHGVGVSQICLRWVLQKGAAMAVGLGKNVTTMAAYAKEDLDLYGFALTDVEMALLDSIGKPITGGGCSQGYMVEA